MSALNDPISAPWWAHAVVYQVYVRSFADGDGDGVGDLPGITARLPHLRDLGVDAVWLTPFYRSPQHDHGYDVADYHDVDPLFGSLDDADALLVRARELGLKVVVDLVHDHRVDTDPGDDGEVLDLTIIDGDLDQVDGAWLPGHRHLDGCSLLERHVQVPGQQVRGTGRDQAHRYPGTGQAVGDDTDGPVPTRPDHQVNARRHGLSRHCATRVFGGRLQPQRVHPAIPVQHIGHQLAERITDLDRVEHHGAPPTCTCVHAHTSITMAPSKEHEDTGRKMAVP